MRSGFRGQTSPTRPRAQNGRASRAPNEEEDAPRAKLVAQRSGGFDEMSVAVFIDDAQAHWVPNVFRAQSGATRSLTARLRAPAILGDSEQGDRRHGPDHAEVEHEPFHAKVSNPTTKPEGLREQRASTVQS